MDVSYALGKMAIDFTALHCDYMTFGGHLIHGPKASGGLVCKDRENISSFISGGLEQGGLRGGFIDESSIVGLAKAFELSNVHLNEMSLEITRLRDLFEKKLKKEVTGATILFEKQKRLPKRFINYV